MALTEGETCWPLIVIVMNTIPPGEGFVDLMLHVKFTNPVCAFGMKIERLPSCETALPGTVALGSALVLFANR